jgi:hypothetical protein
LEDKKINNNNNKYIYGNKKFNAKYNIKYCTLYYVKEKRDCASAMAAHGNRLKPKKFHEETVLIIPYMTQRHRYKLKVKVKVALRGFSTPRPLGSIVFLPQQVPAFIFRCATHHTDARDLYQRRRELFPPVLLADL